MTSKYNQNPLPKKYSPIDHTVVIGKGLVPARAPGNKKLQSIVLRFLEAYSSAVHRTEKSSIVSDVMYAVEQDCEDGIPFVKWDGSIFYEATETQARDKICASFREHLADRYKSSSKNKLAKRRQKRASDTSSKKRSSSVASKRSSVACASSSSTSKDTNNSAKIQPDAIPSIAPCNKNPRAVSVLGGDKDKSEDAAALQLPWFDRIQSYGVAAGLELPSSKVNRSVFDDTEGATSSTTATPVAPSLLKRVSGESATLSKSSLLDDDVDNEAVAQQAMMSLSQHYSVF